MKGETQAIVLGTSTIINPLKEKVMKLSTVSALRALVQNQSHIVYVNDVVACVPNKRIEKAFKDVVSVYRNEDMSEYVAWCEAHATGEIYKLTIINTALIDKSEWIEQFAANCEYDNDMLDEAALNNNLY